MDKKYNMYIFGETYPTISFMDIFERLYTILHLVLKEGERNVGKLANKLFRKAAGL